MEVLLSENLALDWKKCLKNITTRSYLKPFDPVLLQFTEQLSKKILLIRESKYYPEIMALGFWLRKANIRKMKNNFLDQQKNKFILPRGIVLHFAPSNVDTIFVYSWIISLLMGNCNVIRLFYLRC